jgi:hypothetical protein
MLSSENIWIKVSKTNELEYKEYEKSQVNKKLFFSLIGGYRALTNE